MKKISLLSIMVFATLAFTSCGSGKAPENVSDSTGIKEIDTTHVDSTVAKVVVADTTVVDATTVSKPNVVTSKKDTTAKKK
jgi:ABC-type Fe3+-citrate transport system substrate-binding protein